MLKSISGHTTLRFRLQEYLEHDGRAIGSDFLNLTGQQQEKWSLIMDLTREYAGNDRRHGGRPATTYRHFIVSPDPSDRIGLEGLRELATAWAAENFPEYQVAIIYHDDNANGIPHAHVVVNNTNLETGKRLQLSKSDTKKLSSSLQTLSMERNLKHFANVEGEEAHPENVHEIAADLRGRMAGSVRDRRTTGQPEYMPREERAVAERGITTWKQEIRDWAMASMMLSGGTQQGYLDMLSSFGVKASFRKDGSIFYVHPSGHEVSSSRLGTNYSVYGLTTANLYLSMTELASTAAKDTLASRFCGVEIMKDASGMTTAEIKAAAKANSLSLGEVVSAMKEISEERYTSVEAMEKALRSSSAPEASKLLDTIGIVREIGLLPEQEPAEESKAARYRDKRRPVSIQQKVERGYRLTKEEHDMLTDEQLAAWRIARAQKSDGAAKETGVKSGAGRKASQDGSRQAAADARNRHRNQQKTRASQDAVKRRKPER